MSPYSEKMIIYKGLEYATEQVGNLIKSVQRAKKFGRSLHIVYLFDL